MMHTDWKKFRPAVICRFKQLATLGGLAVPVVAGLAAAPAPDFKREIEPLLTKYCYDCHSDGTDKGGVDFTAYKSPDDLLKDRHTWLGVWRNLDSQLMPPAKKAQPSAAERALIERWIERAVFKMDPENPDPGRVTVRRLNREEYRNTIRDLTGVEFDANDAFPADDTGYGFDTIGDVLNISPLLLEKYLDAAQDIVSRALEAGAPRVPSATLGADGFKSRFNSKRTGKWLPFEENPQVQQARNIEFAGPYRVTVELQVSGSKEATVHAANVLLRLNGREIDQRDLGWDNRKSMTFSKEVVLKKGQATFGLDVVERTKPLAGEGQLAAVVEKFTLTGPLDRSQLTYPSEYRRIFVDGPPPADESAREAYARKLLGYFADRAFRRPVDAAMLDKLTALARKAERQPGMNFEKGIGQALTAVLASPRFLFRAEIQAEPDNPGKVVPVDEFALASRLSYFLWSTMPDDELFLLARQGKLRANLRAQLDRMIADGRSQRLVRNFVGQWLQTRDVEGINVDARRVLGLRDRDEANKIFSYRVRQAMRAETELMFGYLLRENRSANELLVSDYTFLNESLARFYGIPNVKGTDMRKVSLTPGLNRGGLLTHGSFLLVTSNPTRTSPVKRGLFVLDNLLGTPAPPAPPNVPTLEDAKKDAKTSLTMRQLMEVHREKPLCASCHARMDPLGLALENYNALGQFRDTEGGQKIDGAGQLITGEKFKNVQELARILVGSRRHDYYRCLTEKLLTYAIGRGPEYYDTTTIDRITAALEKDGGRMRSLVYGIVESAPFQKRRGDGDPLASGGQ